VVRRKRLNCFVAEPVIGLAEGETRWLLAMTAEGGEMTSIVLDIDNLVVGLGKDPRATRIIDGVSLQVREGETLCVVGESGSGKSVTSLTVMGLLQKGSLVPSGGSVKLVGEELLTASDRRLRQLRATTMAMIFQEPMTALNPVVPVGRQIDEVLRVHTNLDAKARRQRILAMMEQVRLPDVKRIFASYPHRLSGGQRQRIMIAMALVLEPKLLIADEPTTALDVTIQAQILELIKDLKARMGTSVILITHDLGVVAGMTENIIVMYAGKVFEQAPTRELFAAPANPYTKGLLKSVPDPAHEQGIELYQIPGLPPDVAHLPPGCPFAERCYRAEEICTREFPPFVRINENHRSLCHFAEEVYAESLSEKK
jgi:peptide/nickel transport system ATP-binding protein